MSRIVSVNLAVPEPNPATGVGVTGINKRPVDHLVTVRAPGPKTIGLHGGLVGDLIFDIEHHGGDDQAVYVYAREDYDWWQARLSRRLANGCFGENLTTEGVDVNGAVIGERWCIGPRLVLQPTFGRIPCVTFGRKMGEPRWVKTFTRSNRPGQPGVLDLRVRQPPGIDPKLVALRPFRHVDHRSELGRGGHSEGFRAGASRLAASSRRLRSRTAEITWVESCRRLPAAGAMAAVAIQLGRRIAGVHRLG